MPAAVPLGGARDERPLFALTVCESFDVHFAQRDAHGLRHFIGQERVGGARQELDVRSSRRHELRLRRANRAAGRERRSRRREPNFNMQLLRAQTAFFAV